MKKWEVFAVQNVEAAEEIINKLVSEGYEKEDISVLAKSKHNKNLETLAEKENIEIERPVNEEAFGIISGILQSLSGAIVIPQAYNPKYGALYVAGPFAKWFSKTDDKSVKRLLEDFDLTEKQVDKMIENLHADNILIFAR
ncbi:sulfate transporter [Listeria monocytogenes]|nr:sulfate transporter [Listeria monocytogenes]